MKIPVSIISFQQLHKSLVNNILARMNAIHDLRLQVKGKLLSCNERFHKGEKEIADSLM